MNDQIRLADLANASGKDLAEFITQNGKVITEVTQHISNLEQLGGTSKAHALGYQAYLADDFNIQDLSDHLSKKGYQMSLESLASVLLVAGSVAIVAGIGYIAYKMIKMSMSKAPKSSEVLARKKEVEKFIGLFGRVDLSDQTEEFKKLFRERAQSDSLPAAVVDIDSDKFMTHAFDAYVRTSMIQKELPLYSIESIGKEQGSQLIYAADIYLGGVREAMEAFKNNFLSVIGKNAEMPPAELAALIDSIDWAKFESQSGGGTAKIEQWAKLFNVVVNKRGDLPALLESANKTLFVKASPAQISAVDWQESVLMAYPDPGDYDRFYDKIAYLKKLGEGIRSTSDHYLKSVKLPKQVADKFNVHVEHAMEMLRTVEMLEKCVRHESDSLAKLILSFVAAGKNLYKAVIACAKQLKDDKEVVALVADVNEAAKAGSAMFKMTTESLVDTTRHSIHDIMVLEGRGQWMELFKAIGLAVILGAAIGLLYSAVMSMLGLASMSSAWKGGISFINKQGKRITKDEASAALVKSLKDRGVGQYGHDFLTHGGKPPFWISKAFVSVNFSTVSSGIKEALSNFGATINLRGDKEQVSMSLLEASKKGRTSISGTTDKILQQMEEMGLRVKDLSPTDREALSTLRERYNEYHEKWFNNETVNDSKLKSSGFSTMFFSSLDDKAPEEIDKYGEAITADIQSFGRRVRTADKETLKLLSPEAREEHEKFMAEIGFVSACAGVMTKISQSAMRDLLSAMAGYRDTFKMIGEGLNEGEGEEEVDELEYDDQVTDSLDTAAGLSEADLDQATRVEVIQEGWGNAAKTGLIIIGALAVLGAGAMILKSMSKRESPQKAKPEHFFKVTAGARASTAFDKIDHDIQKMQNELDDALKNIVKRPPVATRFDDRNSAAAVLPEASVDKSEEELVNVSAIYKEIESSIRARPYVKRLEEQLVTRKAGRVLWGAVMKGPKEAFKMTDNIVSEGVAKEIAGLLRGAVEDIIIPLISLSNSNEPNSEAERIYDDIVSAIEKFSQSKLALEAVERTEACVAFREGSVAYPDAEEQKGIIEMFNPEGMKNADVNYHPMYKTCVVVLDDIHEIVELAEHRSKNDFTAKLELLRGNRNKASSLLRRVDEFKPTFTAVARFAREMHTSADVIVRSVLEALQVHRQVQKDYAVMVKELGLAAARAKIALDDTYEEGSRQAAITDDFLKKVEETSKLFREAGF